MWRATLSKIMALNVQSARLSKRGEGGEVSKVKVWLEKIVGGCNLAYLNTNIRMMSTKMELSDND